MTSEFASFPLAVRVFPLGLPLTTCRWKARQPTEMAKLAVVPGSEDRRSSGREVLEFGCAVSACEPVARGGYGVGPTWTRLAVRGGGGAGRNARQHVTVCGNISGCRRSGEATTSSSHGSATTAHGMCTSIEMGRSS